MSLKGIAKETLKIQEEGFYFNNKGEKMDLSKEQKKAENGTLLYTPEKGLKLLSNITSFTSHITSIEVTNEKAQEASKRMVADEKCSELVLLSFASARNPGGGFIKGAKAQEEDLARCSGVYNCLLKQPQYYRVNRNQESLLYTDHIIYSPQVPWFRVHNRKLLEDFYLASVITAPAPNAGQHLRKYPNGETEIERTLRHRAGVVLAIAKEHNHKNILLGAWGCGVFCNDPDMVADAFGSWLGNDVFKGFFKRVVFAVYDTSEDQETFNAFRERFL